MYRTCLYCNASLGTNDTLEHFPIGRRVAFDPDKGRVWAICGRCGRWNLSPFETRWEAIEDAEQYFRAATKGVRTDNIGLARLGEGLDLVRIGKALRPEFSAWRYGPLARRRRPRPNASARPMATARVGADSLWAGVSARALARLVVLRPALASLAALAASVMPHLRDDGTYPWFVRDRNNALLQVRLQDTRHSRLVVSESGEPLQLILWHEEVAQLGSITRKLGFDRYRPTSHRRTDLHGEQATRAMATVITGLNTIGTTSRHVGRALALIEARLDTNGPVTTDDHGSLRPEQLLDAGVYRLSEIEAPARLALEMLLHERQERHALTGALAELETRWREAEEIAAIADSLVLHGALDGRLEGLKARRATRT